MSGPVESVPAEAVETVARAMWEHWNATGPDCNTPWDLAAPWDRDATHGEAGAVVAFIRDALHADGPEGDAMRQALGLLALIANAKAEALREAADSWQSGQGLTVMIPRPPKGSAPPIAYAQRALDWLRERADRIDAQP